MLLRKNTRLGKIRFSIFFLIFFLFLTQFQKSVSEDNLMEGSFTSIKILDKISSKNTLLKLKNGIDTSHKDLLIKRRSAKIQNLMTIPK